VYSEGNEARVDVRDQGIGISAENQKRIFQQFERVSAKHAVSGLGLGLFISDQIVAAHGGTISVESEEGNGSLFRAPCFAFVCQARARGQNSAVQTLPTQPLICDLHGRISSY
jgi:K+-sensing histidine kinase KdpD